MRRSRIAGFTLLELLVVVAIVAVLIGLLLPAVQKVREAAAALGCASNLKQLGIAHHAYHGAHGSFPLGYRDRTFGGDVDACESTWVTWLLPFIEQDNLFRTADMSRGFGQINGPAHPNYRVASTPLTLMECPSDGRGADELLWGAWRRGNYGGNSGVGPMVYPYAPYWPEDSVVKQGVFLINSRTRLIDITDGASTTALLSEIIKVPGRDHRGVMHYPEGPLYQHNTTPNSSVPDEIRTPECVSVPEAPCIGTFGGFYTRRMIMAARSRHPGGVNVVLADGSVRRVANTVGVAAWQALGTVREGEAVALGD